MQHRQRRPPLDWRAAAGDLIDEIVATAERIASARSPIGERVFPITAQSRLLRVLQRSPYCLSIADVARELRVSRQAAHRLVYEVAACGRVELLTNHDDARILQVVLTKAGRAELAGLQRLESAWLNGLLNGLDDRAMAGTTHVLGVIRRRLERGARELARRKRIPLELLHHLGESP